jgi:hypothetical protein
VSSLPAVTPARLALRVYGALLRLYPARYRQAYGPVMAQLFRDLLRDADAQAGAGRRAAPLLGLWLRVLFDTLRSAPAERWAELRGGLLRGLCLRDSQRLSWRAYGLATVLVVAGILGKALVLRATGSLLASVAVVVVAAVLAVFVLDSAMTPRGRLLLGGLVLTSSMFLPLAWTPDAAAWLSKNPLTAYTLLWLPFGWRRSGTRLPGIWLTVVLLAGVNLLSALLIGP